MHVQNSIPFGADLLALTKPRITAMTVIVALGAMYISGVEFGFSQSAWTLLGIGLLVSASSSLNMYIERDLDALMERTKNRPLPSGRLAPFWALVLGFSCLVLSLLCLGIFSNNLTLALGILSFIFYVWIYTPLKTVSWVSLMVGAIPGASPALLGYVAATNKVDATAICLFAIAFMWQLPHVFAISIFRGDEYEGAGFPVASKTWGIVPLRWLIVLTTLILALVSLCLYFLSVAGIFYLVTAAGIGLWFLWVCTKGFACTDSEIDAWGRKVFRASLVHQTVLFMALVLDFNLTRWF